MKYLVAITISLFVCASAHAERFRHITGKISSRAETLTCTSTVDVATLRNVLYKNENVHGSRGRTFLDQDRRLGGTSRLKVAGLNGNVFSCFGLYACDRPFGCRYYQAMCRDTLSNRQFISRARANGGDYVLVGRGNGACYKVKASAARYGSVRK